MYESFLEENSWNKTLSIKIQKCVSKRIHNAKGVILQGGGGGEKGGERTTAERSKKRL